MFRVRIVCLVLVLACLLGAGSSVLAAQVDTDATYCFTAQEFSAYEEEALAGICITDIPGEQGVLMLENRVLREGDILTAQQIDAMTFRPAAADGDVQAVLSYLPIYEDRVERGATMAIHIRGKEDQAPTAQDSALETYKNVPNQGVLKASDPEGQMLSYTLIRGPKRGEVTINEDGSFTYTPKKNKVGVDSFTYTATDPAGNVSREATVTVQIIKPTDARQYTDTMGKPCQFEAEWMRNTGLFVGESVNGQSCFQPDKSVSRGEFLAMMVKMLDIPVEDSALTSLPEETPDWLKPYLAAAIRSGLMDRIPEQESFGMDAPISGAEAAVMLQNALDLSVNQEVLEAQQTMAQENAQEVPAWAAASLTVMADNGVALSGVDILTRGDAAQVLYKANQLAMDAPGMMVIRMQQ